MTTGIPDSQAGSIILALFPYSLYSETMRASDKHQGVEDARRNLPALLERANRGQTVVITKRGKPFAAIVPVDRATAKNSGLSLSELRGTGKGMWGRNATAWVERLRKEW